MPSRKNRSEDISGLIKALSAAQGEIKDIERNRKVTVRTRGGDEYSFKYATLSAIIDGIRAPMSKHGLAYTQTLEHDDGYYVLTTTLHWENQFMSSVTPIIISGGSNQEFGSALTYMKRYALAALVGVAPDEDDDGNAADGNEVKAMQESKRSPAPPVSDPIKPPTTPGPEVDFNPDRIDIPLDQDGLPVWMEWGKLFMAMARRAPSNEALQELCANNAETMEVMKEEAAKLYKNMITAIQKLNPGVS